MDTLALVVVVSAALFYTGVNGFRDSADAIATSVSARALTPRVAVTLAALMNLAGAFLGTTVARVVSEDLVTPPEGGRGLLMLFAAVCGALLWSAAAWYLRLPSSSSQALFGGLVGAVLAGAGAVHWGGVLLKVVLPLLLAPLVAMVVGHLVMVGLLWAFRRAQPHRAQRGFRAAQTVSTAGMALGHGVQDAQKTMGVVVLALVVAGEAEAGSGVPLWAQAACAVMLAAGTYAGGWRVVRALGRRVFAVDAPRGFAAESSAAAVMFASAFVLHAPVATTHVVTGSIVGAGTTRRRTVVRWGVARTIVIGWSVTLPAVALLAAALFLVGAALLPV
ncbi:inorganic phosphate transporter [Streptomyces spiramenti]|uniref:Inorganic phosphate transporter n=1 Tax=Streptomyces spiramenti TaxID=2720606 RepID=A0ABX1APJ8_9ACTN|nr:inorganic phosphate transporter [Streptomyces spiramenti]NJP67005.1 inorganic phosphate transporter [Streptomyces spiramenti]